MAFSDVMGGHLAGGYLLSDWVTSLTRTYLVKLYHVLPCSLIRLLTSDLISFEPQSTKPLSRKTTLPSLSIRYETGMPKTSYFLATFPSKSSSTLDE